MARNGSSNTAIVAILVIAVLILAGWFFFFRENSYWRSERTTVIERPIFERPRGDKVDIDIHVPDRKK